MESNKDRERERDRHLTSVKQRTVRERERERERESSNDLKLAGLWRTTPVCGTCRTTARSERDWGLNRELRIMSRSAELHALTASIDLYFIGMSFDGSEAI